MGRHQSRPSRRHVIALAGAAAAGLSLPAQGAEPAPVASTRYGKIRGQAKGIVKMFRGIAYGAPTAGAGRFLPPGTPESWSGIRDAIAYGDQAPQQGSAGLMEEERVSLDASPMSENCLFLNVWTAGLRDGAKRPVMVWLHGGGFSSGSGGNVRYDGSNLARKHGVVLVTVNHRLNAFGFLYLGGIGGEKYADSGNAGMLDIVAALNWIKDNIAEFGGDPGNVTVFGQSGGGSKATTLMAMPQAAGKIHRVIAESGLELQASTADDATGVAKKLMTQLGVKTADELQQLPYQAILAGMAAAGPGANRFGPVLDGRSLVSGKGPFDPVAPSLSADVPMLLGSTLTEITFMGATPLDPIDEATLKTRVMQQLHVDAGEADTLVAQYKRDYPDAAPVRLYQLIATDNWLTANVALVAERKAALGKAPAYVYHFEKPTPVRGGKLGVPHTLEIPYVFDNLDAPTATRITGDGPERQALADRMSAAWTRFARTGNPNINSLPHWPAYSAASRAVMIFNDESKLVMDPHPEARMAITDLHMRQGQVTRG